MFFRDQNTEKKNMSVQQETLSPNGWFLSCRRGYPLPSFLNNRKTLCQGSENTTLKQELWFITELSAEEFAILKTHDPLAEIGCNIMLKFNVVILESDDDKVPNEGGEVAPNKNNISLVLKFFFDGVWLVERTLTNEESQNLYEKIPIVNGAMNQTLLSQNNNDQTVNEWICTAEEFEQFKINLPEIMNVVKRILRIHCVVPVSHWTLTPEQQQTTLDPPKIDDDENLFQYDVLIKEGFSVPFQSTSVHELYPGMVGCSARFTPKEVHFFRTKPGVVAIFIPSKITPA